MSKDDMELVRGSGNVFRDLGLPNPEVEQLKAILAAKIIAVLDEQGISVRHAHELTGFAAADFSVSARRSSGASQLTALSQCLIGSIKMSK